MTDPDLPIDVATVPAEAEDEFVEAQVFNAQVEAAAAARAAEPAEELPVDVAAVPAEAEAGFVAAQVLQAQVEQAEESGE